MVWLYNEFYTTRRAFNFYSFFVVMFLCGLECCGL